MFFTKIFAYDKNNVIISEVCSEPCQISKMESFEKIVNG